MALLEASTDGQQVFSQDAWHSAAAGDLCLLLSQAKHGNGQGREQTSPLPH